MRDEVRLFAEAMERKLQKREKDYPEGWKSCDIHRLFDHLVSEVSELEDAIEKDNEFISNECVDIANMAMMIADVIGSLNEQED